jgi:hypothetical protein
LRILNTHVLKVLDMYLGTCFDQGIEHKADKWRLIPSVA